MGGDGWRGMTEGGALCWAGPRTGRQSCSSCNCSEPPQSAATRPVLMTMLEAVARVGRPQECRLGKTQQLQSGMHQAIGRSHHEGLLCLLLLLLVPLQLICVSLPVPVLLLLCLLCSCLHVRLSCWRYVLRLTTCGNAWLTATQPSIGVYCVRVGGGGTSERLVVLLHAHASNGFCVVLYVCVD